MGRVCARTQSGPEGAAGRLPNRRQESAFGQPRRLLHRNLHRVSACARCKGKDVQRLSGGVRRRHSWPPPTRRAVRSFRKYPWASGWTLPANHAATAWAIAQASVTGGSKATMRAPPEAGKLSAFRTTGSLTRHVGSPCVSRSSPGATSLPGMACSKARHDRPSGSVTARRSGAAASPAGGDVGFGRACSAVPRGAKASGRGGGSCRSVVFSRLSGWAATEAAKNGSAAQAASKACAGNRPCRLSHPRPKRRPPRCSSAPPAAARQPRP